MSDFKPGSIDEALERMIDAHSLLHVLTALECICAEKAEHIRTNWQDNLTAKRWNQASKACGNVARNEASAVS